MVYLLGNLGREVKGMMSFQLNQLLGLNYWQQVISADFLSKDFVVNIVNILVAWYLVYKLIMLIRGTKTVQLSKGVAVFIIICILSEIIGLHTLSWLMNQVIVYGVTVAVVIFQPEVRRGLEHLGRSSFFRPSEGAQQENERIIQASNKATQYMSKRRIGALITIERNTGLDEYIETGTDLDADATGELLINISIPSTPLHDGTVIIKNEKIAAASAYLPLSESNLIPKEFGTRHRAAVGISEASDAIAIVISEEIGDVSLTLNSKLIPGLTQEEYLTTLRKELVSELSEDKKSALQHPIDDVTKRVKRK